MTNKIVYGGELGRTNAEDTTVVCAGCGSFFGAKWQKSLNVESDKELVWAFAREGYAAIGSMKCPKCGAIHIAEEPILIHFPGIMLLLVLPDSRRHAVLQLQADCLKSLAASPGEVLPEYALHFETLIGICAFQKRLAELQNSENPEQIEIIQDLGSFQNKDSAELLSAVSKISENLEVEAQVQESLESDNSVINSDDSELSAELIAALSNETEASDEEFDENDVSIETPSPFEVLDDEQLENHSEIIGDSHSELNKSAALKNYDIIAPKPILQVLNGQVVLRFSVLALRTEKTEKTLTASELTSALLRFQLHQTPAGPCLAILVIFASDAPKFLLCPLQAGDADHEAVLERLSEHFAVTLLVEIDGTELSREIELPLEQNVHSARLRLAGQAVEHDSACSALQQLDFEVLSGKLKHNFNEQTFAQIATAADAKLALGIIDYWSSQIDYLLFIQSFPKVWFDEMVRRVLGYSLYFGLALSPSMTKIGKQYGVPLSSIELLQQRIAAFTEVSLSIRPSGLDAIETWDNWEALLMVAQEAGLPLDASIEDLAYKCMERARKAAQGEGEPLSDEHLSLDESMSINGDDIEIIEDSSMIEDFSVNLSELSKSETFDRSTFLNLSEHEQILYLGELESSGIYSDFFVNELARMFEEAQTPRDNLVFGLACAAFNQKSVLPKLVEQLLWASPDLFPFWAQAIAQMGETALLFLLSAATNPDAEARIIQTLVRMQCDLRAFASKTAQNTGARRLLEQVLAMGDVAVENTASLLKRLEEASAVLEALR